MKNTETALIIAPSLKPAGVYLIVTSWLPFSSLIPIRASWTETTSVELPKDAVRYTLAGRDGIRSRVMTLNGRELILGENDALPCLGGEEISAGSVELAPGSCTFFVM